MVCVLQTKAKKADKIGMKNKVNNCMSVSSHYPLLRNKLGFCSATYIYNTTRYTIHGTYLYCLITCIDICLFRKFPGIQEIPYGILTSGFAAGTPGHDT